MNKQILSLILLTVILVSLTSVTALLIDPTTQTIDATHGTTVTGTFDVENNEGSDVNVTISNTGFTFTPSSFSLANGATQTVQFSYAVAEGTAPGLYTHSFTANSDTGDVKINVLSTPTLSISTIPELSKQSTEVEFEVENTGNVDLANIVLDYDADTLKDKSGREITLEFDPDTIISLLKGQSQTVTLTATIPDSMNLGEWSTKVSATTGTTTAEADATVKSDFCRLGKIGSLVEITKLEDNEIDNEDPWEWRPLDNVEIEVKVRNNGDEDEDFTVKLVLYDVEDQQEIDDNDLDDQEDTKEIRDGKTETFTFAFEVPTELEEKTYRLYVKAYLDGEEETECVDFFDSTLYEEVDIKKSSRDIVIKDVEVPDFVGCDEEATIHAKVYNVGEKDEDKVRVRIYNKELGIDEYYKTFDLDEGDSKSISFVVNIPEDAEEKTYNLDLSAEFDYDEDDDVYDKETEYVDPKPELVVQGNCLLVQEPLITAELISDAKAGEELNVKITVTNTGTKQTTYTLSVTGYDSWSSLERVSPTTLTVAAGQSASANVYITPNTDATGDNTFVIKVVYDSMIAERDVLVSIEGKGGALTGFAIGESFKENWFMWVIVLVNIILIIAIIIVVARILSR